MKKADNPFSFRSYHTKIANAILSLLGFLFVVWSVIFEHSEIGVLDETKVRVGLWFMALGLFGMAFSEEKIDDERVKEIRHVVMRNCLRFLLTVLLIISLKSIYKPDFGFKFVLELSILTLLSYHIFFNAALYFNPSWITTENKPTGKNRIQPKYYLLFVIVQLILLAILYWFRQ